MNGHASVQRLSMPVHSTFANVPRSLGKKDLYRRRSDRPDLLSVWALRTIFAAGLSVYAVA